MHPAVKIVGLFLSAGAIVIIILEVLVVHRHSSPCIVSKYEDLQSTVAKCTNIKLQDLYVPDNSSLDLSKLKPNSKVRFAGKTTFGYSDTKDIKLISISGHDIHVSSELDAIIDGNGQAYWDGQGSNGGVEKPGYLITIKNVTRGTIENLHIQNYAAHGVSIEKSSKVTLRNIFIDMRAGDVPNERSGRKPAAHNTDGFGIKTSENIVISSSTVYNQDDCVAITSGNNLTVTGMLCSGSHGLSIGSVGGKDANDVTNVVFSNSTILNSENGCRIKSNFNTTGFISNITYSSIRMDGITDYGIDVQQDYLNGGPTGTPSNGVVIENVVFKNITGTVSTGEGKSTNYLVRCGTACRNFKFEDVSITGAGNMTSCNYPLEGCPGGIGVNGTLVGA